MSSGSALQASIGSLERHYRNLTGYAEAAVKALPSSLILRVFAKIGAFFQWFFRCESWIPSALKACRIADSSQCEKAQVVAKRILALEECRYVVRKIQGQPNESLARKMHEFLFFKSSDIAVGADVIDLIRMAVSDQSNLGIKESPLVLSASAESLVMPAETDFSQLSIYRVMENRLRSETPVPTSHSQVETPELSSMARGMPLPYQESAGIPQAFGAFEPFREIKIALRREDSNLTGDLLRRLDELEQRGEPLTEDGQTELSRAVYVIKGLCLHNFHGPNKDNGFPLMRKLLARLLDKAEPASLGSNTLVSLADLDKFD